MTDVDQRYLYDRVYDLVVGQIRAGSLRPGDRLPSLRRMSGQLKVSIATVMQGYVNLEQEGFIDARPQSGYYVKSDPGAIVELPNPTAPKVIARDVQLSALVQQMLEVSRRPGTVPLALANPDNQLLPGKSLCRILHRVANRDPDAAIAYLDTQGLAELRRHIAYRSSVLGSVVDPAQVVITNGATEALALSLKSVTRTGDTVAVESPGYFSVFQLIEDLGLKAVEVPMHPREGLLVEEFERTAIKLNVKALICISNFNNPYGSLMPDESKQALVDIANHHGVRIVEDDIYGDLHFGPHRPRPIASFDPSGNVVTCSSFSKTLAPGFRVGWLIAERSRQEIMSRKHAVSIATATVTQLAISEFLSNGGYERHLRTMRRRLQKQVARYRHELIRQLPVNTRISEPQGGLVLWVELPRGKDANLVFNEAMAQGVSILPGTVFSTTRKYRNCFRISCGALWSEEIEQGVTRLAKVIHAL